MCCISDKQSWANKWFRVASLSAAFLVISDALAQLRACKNLQSHVAHCVQLNSIDQQDFLHVQ